MRTRNRQATRPDKASNFDNATSIFDKKLCYEGEDLARLLKLIKSELDSARNSDSTLPEKVWIKQQFSIGVNEVTRVLERMHAKNSPNRQSAKSIENDRKATVELQAILLASDCNPRWLTKHLPDLANSRGVPLIFVKDKREASLRLGEVLKLRTAMAIGIKDRGNSINQLINNVLTAKEINVDTAESSDLPII